MSEFDIVYLIVDAVYESIRPYIRTNEAILVAYGIDSEGRKVLLHMDVGNKESYDFCRDFLRNETVSQPIREGGRGDPCGRPLCSLTRKCQKMRLIFQHSPGNAESNPRLR